jgi:glucose-1-phosphate thymidylyltransferase
LSNRIIGLIPAAGEAKRLAPLPCSKELLPVGSWTLKNGTVRPKPACLYLLEKMKYAGIKNVYIIIRNGKWDIPAYLGDGSLIDAHIAYLMMGSPYGAPFSLDQAYPFVKDSIIALGYPDIIFKPDDAYMQLMDKYEYKKADVILGLFRTEKPEKMDMVHLDRGGRVRDIDIKPKVTDLQYTWTIALWNQKFTEFMHSYITKIVEVIEQNKETIARKEYYVGNVFRDALKEGFIFDSVIFNDGFAVDIGTEEELFNIKTGSL